MILLRLLRHEELRPVHELLLDEHLMLALLGALEGPDALLKGLRLLVETLKTQDLRLLLQVEDLT